MVPEPPRQGAQNRQADPDVSWGFSLVHNLPLLPAAGCQGDGGLRGPAAVCPQPIPALPGGPVRVATEPGEPPSDDGPAELRFPRQPGEGEPPNVAADGAAETRLRPEGKGSGSCQG